MKNTRYALGSANRVCASTTTLINGNGSYAGAPAKSEDAQYPMTNLQVNERFTIWRSATALAGTFNLDFDLGADVNIDTLAIHGFRRASGQTAPNALDVQYKYAVDTYSGGSWKTAKSALSLAGRDAGVQLPGVIRARYWRFVIGVGATGGGFSIGTIYMGVASDLGYLYGPGAEERYIDPTTEVSIAGAIPVNGVTCDPFYLITLPFESAPDTLKDTLRAIALDIRTAPVTILNPLDVVRQYRLQGGQQAHQHMWHAGAGNWNTALELRSLP